MSAFLPEAFEIVVDHLLDPQSPKSEPFFRTAVGRAYYAAHLSARELLLAKKRRVARGSRGQVTHPGVIDALRSGPNPGVGDKLHQLGKLRERADYDLGTPVGLPEAQAAKLLVREILSKLNNAT